MSETKIFEEIIRIFTDMKADSELLSILGSYHDTLGDNEVLQYLECYEVTSTLESDCKNCEAELMLELASVQLRLDTANRYNSILEKCLDVKDMLCGFYREENEQLKNRISFLEEMKKCN